MTRANSILTPKRIFFPFYIDFLGPTEKEGICPELPPGTVGICLQECENDFDCNGDLKCCKNGCGHVCTKPGKTTFQEQQTL